METIQKGRTLTADEVHALSQELKRQLTQLYGDKLEQIILYGSYARGDAHPESDIDFMIVLQDTVQAGREIRRMASITGSLSLLYDIEVSVFPVTASLYSSDYTPLYRAVHQEGVFV